MHTATAPTIPALLMLPHAGPAGTAPPVDDAWWVELFGWQATCDDVEPTDERLMHQASLLALLSVA
jgi:hypothetical protein